MRTVKDHIEATRKRLSEAAATRKERAAKVKQSRTQKTTGNKKKP
jgi:hypothetical protein